jgi:hypothetical protein
MTATIKFMAAFLTLAAICASAWAQAPPTTADEQVQAEEAATVDDSTVVDDAAPVEESTPVEASAPDPPAGDATPDSIDDVAEEVDESEEAKQASAGILNPIYSLAERFSFPWFHWIAFSLMVAGVVSFALQLVLGKLVVLAKASMSLSEILSDALGLAVSLIGLVLTTQAAAENSDFTTSAFKVLSATAAGALAGLIFYWWGQKQELQAVAGRRAAAAARDILPPRT